MELLNFVASKEVQLVNSKDMIFLMTILNILSSNKTISIDLLDFEGKE